MPVFLDFEMPTWHRKIPLFSLRRLVSPIFSGKTPKSWHFFRKIAWHLKKMPSVDMSTGKKRLRAQQFVQASMRNATGCDVKLKGIDPLAQQPASENSRGQDGIHQLFAAMR